MTRIGSCHRPASLGAKRIALVATEVAGSQLQKEQAVKVAARLGLEVQLVLDIASTAPSCRAEINKIAQAKPDAVLLSSQAQDGGTFVKQAAEAGQSWNIIGTTEWLGEAFPASATMDALNQHKKVLISGFSYAAGPTWDYYQPLCTGEATKWSPAMREVAMGPGTKCHSHGECLKLIRAGEAADYSGVSGEMDYTDTGVVSGIYGIFNWTSPSTLEQVATLDGGAVFDLEKQ